MAFATPGNLSLENFGAMLFGRWGCLSEAISELQTQPTKPQRTMRQKGQKRMKWESHEALQSKPTQDNHDTDRNAKGFQQLAMTPSSASG